jgi:xanthine/uracil/vitamin C permease (AzgA family)
MVGVMVMKVVKDIDWTNIKDAVPAFAIMLLMPLTYSIANGIFAAIGLFDYAASIINWLGKMRRIMINSGNYLKCCGWFGCHFWTLRYACLYRSQVIRPKQS